jgi:hypothetical protein
MHDIDRTQLEAAQGFGFESAGPGEFGTGGSGEFGEAESGEAEFGEAGGFGGYAPGHETPLSETTEMELASELLEVSSEEGLEQFLGDVFGSVQSAIGRAVRSDTGRALGGLLKNSLKDVARQALPVVGRAVGQWVDPRRGGEPGARLGAAAGTLLGLELEGLSGEDREFEVARQLVRFTSAAVQNAALAPRTVPGPVAARAAAQQAARVYAPGLLPRLQGRSTRLWPRGGRWIRRGRAIVLYGD